MLPPVVGVLFDGFAYGMLLFLLSVGLSVTLGMMNFVNLAHGAFAMLGGYVTVTLMNALRLAVLRHAAGRVPRRRARPASCSSALLYRRLYRASDLDQVLLTIGLAFMSVAAAAYFFGTDQQPVQLPAYLRGSIDVRRLDFGVYRLFLIGVGARDHARCWSARSNTPASARRCAPRSTTSAWRAGSASMSTASSPSPSRSAAGSPAWAARWRSRSSASIRISRFTYLVYVLIVVAVGGLGSIRGSFAAAVAARRHRRRRQILRAAARRLPDLSGHGQRADVAAGRPVREALSDDASTPTMHRRAAQLSASAQTRWHPIEIAFWLATLLPFLLFADLSVAGQPDRDHRAVCALARPHPRLCRHRLARPRRVLRPWRLYRRACSPNSAGASRSPGCWSPAAWPRPARLC